MTADDDAYAKRMLARGDKYLEQVDNAFIVKQRGHSARAMPTFRPEEISLGKVLGTGGFGVVNSITKFTLDPDEEEKVEQQPKRANGKKAQAHTANDELRKGQKEEKETEQQVRRRNSGNSTGEDSTKEKKEEVMDDNDDDDGPVSHVSVPNALDFTAEKLVGHSDMHDFHYEIKQARKVMEKRVLREGEPRYALKRLHNDLTPIEQARGMIDLAVEAKYLSIVWHPNIVKMRGMAKGPMIDPDFFIILDRLGETLDHKMNRWSKLHKEYNNYGFCGCFKNQKGLNEMVLESLTIAYDLAAAFFYLHENRLVYRDVKPENIGFDMRGDVKVFDFGLCKSLSPELKAPSGQYGYRLTGRAGSLPYMAPEVAKMQTYDTKCDVFSFAILLWEMLSCRPAFGDYSSLQFMEKVVTQEERLPIQSTWPPLTRLMIPEAWDTDPKKRPDMKRIAILIRGDLNDLTTDERILHRTRHLASRSQHSFNEELDSPTSNKKLE